MNARQRAIHAALERFSTAALELDRLWSVADKLEEKTDAALCAHYPDGWPSFDEFAASVAGWAADTRATLEAIPAEIEGLESGRVYFYLTGTWFAVVDGRLVYSAAEDHGGAPVDGWDVHEWGEVTCIEGADPRDPDGSRFLAAVNKAFATKAGACGQWPALAQKRLPAR